LVLAILAAMTCIRAFLAVLSCSSPERRTDDLRTPFVLCYAPHTLLVLLLCLSKQDSVAVPKVRGNGVRHPLKQLRRPVPPRHTPYHMLSTQPPSRSVLLCACMQRMTTFYRVVSNRGTPQHSRRRRRGATTTLCALRLAFWSREVWLQPSNTERGERESSNEFGCAARANLGRGTSLPPKKATRTFSLWRPKRDFLTALVGSPTSHGFSPTRRHGTLVAPWAGGRSQEGL